MVACFVTTGSCQNIIIIIIISIIIIIIITGCIALIESKNISHRGRMICMVYPHLIDLSGEDR